MTVTLSLLVTKTVREMGNCCYSAKKRQISTPLGENILSKEYRNSSSDGSHHRQQLKKYLKQHQSFDLLATSKRSNWVQFRDKDEITSFKKGFCILVDEYLQIYSNEDALPKDLLDIISLRDGNVIDSIKNRIIINDQIVIDYESIEIKKLW